MLQAIKEDIHSCETIIAKVTLRIKEILSPYENVLELLNEVPDLSTKSIEDLVAEIGLDMRVFPTEKHLASWAGVSPGNNEFLVRNKSSMKLVSTDKHPRMLP
jgi:transposase